MGKTPVGQKPVFRCYPDIVAESSIFATIFYVTAELPWIFLASACEEDRSSGRLRFLLCMIVLTEQGWQKRFSAALSLSPVDIPFMISSIRIIPSMTGHPILSSGL